jgi:hypothetical protein
VATGITRPLQLAVHERTLFVLGPGARGDVAGEVYRIDLDAERPVDLSRQPRIRIPFLDERLATLGSLALEPRTRQLFLGEENGARIYRLDPDERLTLYATGLRRVLGGGALAIDPAGRLIVVDHVDPLLTPDPEPLPGLEPFRDDDYRGPLVFRLALDGAVPLPRRLAHQPPLFPRAWGGRRGGGLLPRLVSVVPVAADELVVLTSSGDLLRIGRDGALAPFAQLPRGQYQRTNLAAAPDGSVYVSGGFWVASVYRVGPEGTVAVVATHLADPQGIAVDARGEVYLAESSLHRIVRLRAPASR